MGRARAAGSDVGRPRFKRPGQNLGHTGGRDSTVAARAIAATGEVTRRWTIRRLLVNKPRPASAAVGSRVSGCRTAR
jgi:hypothetical protein